MYRFKKYLINFGNHRLLEFIFANVEFCSTVYLVVDCIRNFRRWLEDDSFVPLQTWNGWPYRRAMTETFIVYDFALHFVLSQKKKMNQNSFHLRLQNRTLFSLCSHLRHSLPNSQRGIFPRWLNSHAWGRAPRRPRDSQFVFEMFLVDRSLRTKKVIPVNKSFTTYVLFRFRRKFNWAERKRISHRPICEFRPKIEF